MTSTTFAIEGMSCASCVGRVERAVAALPGVTSAQANLATATMRAEYAAPATQTAIAAAVEAAGYHVGSSDLTLDIDGMTCASCSGRVERVLKAQPGVRDAAVNLATRSARVSILDGATDAATLAAAVTALGYPATPHRAAVQRDDHNAAEELRQRRAFWLALALTLPVFLVEMGGHLYPPLHHLVARTVGTQASWIAQFVLTSLVLLFPGRQFFSLGIPALMKGAPDMNALVALGSGAAWTFSTVATFAPSLLPAGAVAVYFEAAAVIVTLILLGRMLEARAKGRAGQAITRLLGLRAKTAQVIRDGVPEDIPVEAIRVGDIIALRPGERVATDGEVLDGESWIDAAMLTGEPDPVAVGPGAALTGGTVNGAGALRYRATRVGADTTLARIIRMVEDAQGGKLPIQAVVDRVTLWFVPVVIGVAALAVLGWLIFAPAPALGHALVAGVAVLIIACPCAMGLATPTSILVGTGRAAELGILFRKGEALQRLADIRLVAFDKTGTLTEGAPRLTDLELAPGFSRDEVLSLVAGVETRSEHPIARAILAEAEQRGLHPAEVADFAVHPGYGVTAKAGNRRLTIGADRLLVRDGIDLGPLAEAGARLADGGKTPLYAAIDGTAAAVIAVADPIKPGARAAITRLAELGIKSAMITGDNKATAGRIAAELGITIVAAEVLPEGKVATLAELTTEHGALAFVGDGINDAPALAAADVGIAMGTGTDVAIETGDLVLMSGDPQSVPDALRLSRATMRNIRQNLGWAFGYNVALIPVAAGLFFPAFGWQLSPMLAAGAMAASSVLVVSNALRLRRAGPWRTPELAA